MENYPGDIDESALGDTASMRQLLDRVKADYEPRVPVGNLVGEIFDRVVELHLVNPTLHLRLSHRVVTAF